MEFVANQQRHLAAVKDRLHGPWVAKLAGVLSRGLAAAGKGWACDASLDYGLFVLTKPYRLYVLLGQLMKDVMRRVFWASVAELVDMVTQMGARCIAFLADLRAPWAPFLVSVALQVHWHAPQLCCAVMCLCLFVCLFYCFTAHAKSA